MRVRIGLGLGLDELGYLVVGGHAFPGRLVQLLAWLEAQVDLRRGDAALDEVAQHLGEVEGDG